MWEAEFISPALPPKKFLEIMDLSSFAENSTSDTQIAMVKAASIVFLRLGSNSNQLEPPTLHLGLCKWLTGDILLSEHPKFHLQNMFMLLLSEHTSYGGLCSMIVHAQTSEFFPVLYLPTTLPHSCDYLAYLSQKYS